MPSLFITGARLAVLASVFVIVGCTDDAIIAWRQGTTHTGCDMANAAFCDTFETPSPGGRGGDLDDARWAFAFVGGAGLVEIGFGGVETPMDLCGKEVTVHPRDSSRFCETSAGERRWVTAVDGNGGFVYESARIRQPFDFAGRTGTIRFEVDAEAGGSQAWSAEVWLTDTPVPAPNIGPFSVNTLTSPNAISLTISNGCGSGDPAGNAGAASVGISKLSLIRDYVVTPATLEQTSCVEAAPGALGKFEVRVSESRIEVWGSDASGGALRQLASADVSVPFTRGYVHLNHMNWDPELDTDVPSNHTYQWARVAFDGPVLPTPRAYSIDSPWRPAPVMRHPEGYVNTYWVSNGTASLESLGAPVTLAFMNVDPTSGTSARLTFNTVGPILGDTLQARFNGGAWRDVTYDAPTDPVNSWERETFVIPIPVTDLVSGTNTVDFATTTDLFNTPMDSMYIANIDLEIEVP